MLRYQVDDLSCGHCVQAVTKAIQGVDPRAQVTIDLTTKRLEVLSQAASSQVEQAIREAGYTPAPVAAGPAKAAGRSCCGGGR